MTDKIVALVAANPAIQLLAQVHAGLTVTEMADAQRLAVESVRRTGKKAVISIQITIAPDGKGEVVSVETSAEVKVKLPKKSVRATTFFVTGDNELQRADPNQSQIKFPDQPGQTKTAGQN